MAEEAKKVAEKKPVYYVENTVRRVGSRIHRAKSATRHRFKLYVAGRRVLRNQKMVLNEKEFEANKEQIRKMVLNGQLALHLPDGTRITSLPDGRLVYRRVDGAIKIDEEAQSPHAPPSKPKAKEVTPTPPKTYDPEDEPPKVKYEPKVEQVVDEEEPPEEDKKSKYSSKKKKSSRKKD